MGLLSPCWEQGGPLLYVLACICMHPGCKRLETAMPERRGNREGRTLQELENEGRQRGWIEGVGRKVVGRSGCTMVLFLVQLQGFIILNY